MADQTTIPAKAEAAAGPTPSPAANPAPSSKTPAKKFSIAGAKDAAKKYSKFWLDHVKKGEMPWTQWYCCGTVNGQECEKENHRLHKECKKCGHKVCENCPKSQL